MALNSNVSRAASALPVIGVVLALANWNARPAAAWGWAAVIVMCAIMIVVRHRAHRAVRRSPEDAGSIRTFASVTGGVVWGALIIIIPLAVTLAHAYGLVNDPKSGTRATMFILGAYMVVTGNAIPRMLPPVSSMGGNAAQIQAFRRRTGWMFVLFGLGFAAAWLALPIAAAAPASTALAAAFMILTFVQIFRLRNVRVGRPA